MLLILKPHFWIYIYLFKNGFVLSNIYDKRDDFDFDIINFPFLDGVVHRFPRTVFTFLNSFDLLECLVM